MSRPGRSAVRAAEGLAAFTALQCAYLFGCSIAALRRAPCEAASSTPLRLAVLVPAHDEAAAIATAIGSLRACDYPEDHRSLIVIADNCGDDTADRARRAGAEVLERSDPAHPGKGAAVAWALSRLLAERPDLDAIVMMDADCTADPGLLRGLAAPLQGGAGAVQGAFLASNPEASRTAALRWAGYALINRIRPAGKQALGLSCGLTGSAMAFTIQTLTQVPWQALSVTEDKEQHLHLVLAGVPVAFSATAIVQSPMPTQQRSAATQQLRWETGNVQLARRWVPRLLRAAARRRDADAAHAAWELLVGPLSMLVAAQVAAAGLGRLLGRRRLGTLARIGMSSLIGHVAVGLAVARAPRSVYRALLGAPQLVAVRLVQYAGLIRGRGHREWQRTLRES